MGDWLLRPQSYVSNAMDKSGRGRSVRFHGKVNYTPSIPVGDYEDAEQGGN